MATHPVNVFISWSGVRSKILASALYNWIRKVIQPVRPWMSQENIPKGVRWAEEVAKNLKKTHLGIICITPENQDAPWLLFEAGALSKTLGKSQIYPMLIGMTPRDLQEPLSQFQATSFTKEDMFKLVKDINDKLGDLRIDDDVLKDSFEIRWIELEKTVRDRIENSEILLEPCSARSVLHTLKNDDLIEPMIGRCSHFSKGFESHQLYNSLLPAVKNRLYIFGRKNRKLFDKEHYYFFEKLPDRIKNGFDFRCLFLNPSAPDNIVFLFREPVNFLDELRNSLKQAHNVFKSANLDIRSLCRLYGVHRSVALFVVDNAVLFSPITFGHDGKIEPLTHSPFSICDSETSCGKKFVENFLSTWENSEPIK